MRRRDPRTEDAGIRDRTNATRRVLLINVLLMFGI